MGSEKPPQENSPGLRNMHVVFIGKLRNCTHARRTRTPTPIHTFTGSLRNPKGCGWLVFMYVFVCAYVCVCVWIEGQTFECWIQSQGLQEILYNQEKSHLNTSQILE